MSEETDQADDQGGDEHSQALELEMQRRLMLKALTPILQLRSHDTDPSGRVQLAFDLMHTAVCERVVRLCHTDLPADPA
jgi:hypothetical protein